jgi:hypothetical protein
MRNVLASVLLLACVGCMQKSFIRNDGYAGPRAAVTAEQVKVFTSPPSAAYSEVGVAEVQAPADSNNMNGVIAALREVAAAQGGNGIIVMASESRQQVSGTSYNWFKGGVTSSSSSKGASAKALVIYLRD